MGGMPGGGDWLILLLDLRVGSDNVAIVVGHEEVAVCNPDGTGIGASHNVYSVMIIPEPPYLNAEKIAATAQGVHDKLADGGVPLLALLFILLLRLFLFRIHW